MERYPIEFAVLNGALYTGWTLSKGAGGYLRAEHPGGRVIEAGGILDLIGMLADEQGVLLHAEIRPDTEPVAP